MNYFSIKELETFSGIKAHTIRTWEQRFTFLQPKRSNKLRRAYSFDELKLLLDISFLNRNGYKVSHIAKMDRLDIDFTLSSLSSDHHKKERAVQELIVLMAGMDTDGFDRVLDNCTANWGIGDTITAVILPFAYKAGLFHQEDNKFCRSNRLLVEQSIKQRLLTGSKNAGLISNGKKALFLLAKKSSELELLYMQYVLRANGFSTLFISQLTSLPDLEMITAVKQPDVIITALPEKKQPFNIRKFLDFLAIELPGTEFFNLGKASPEHVTVGTIAVRQSEDPAALLEMILKKERVASLQSLN